MFKRLRAAREYFEDAEQRERSVTARDQRSVARDLVIALLHPDKGKVPLDTDIVVGGALLAELVQQQRIRVTASAKKVRVAVDDPTPLGDQELDEALVDVGAGLWGSKVTTLLEFMPPTILILRRLVRAGVLEDTTRTRLGVFTVHGHRPTPSAGRDALVVSIRSALLGESVPDERTALMLGLVDAGRMLQRFVPGREVDAAHRRVVEALERIGEGERAVVEATEVKVDRAHRSD